jgi:hypothetical protein
MLFRTAAAPFRAPVTLEPLRIYTGLLGQLGDIICFTATARRIKELFPNSSLTFAVSRRYSAVADLLSGLRFIDRVFITEHYYERLSDKTYFPWHLGWPCKFKGDDEIHEERNHDLVFETRPQHRRMPWWEFAHQVAELAHMVGVPGPIGLQTEVRIPEHVSVPINATGKIVLHNDPHIDATKAWDWREAEAFVGDIGPDRIILLGSPGSVIPGTIDLRGQTTLSQAAAVIRDCACYVGIDSGLIWIAGSLQVPTVGLYGTSYIPAYQSIWPSNPNAYYVQVEGSPASIPASQVTTLCRRLCAIREYSR